MAIEKMTMLRIVGSLNDRHSILRELILSDNVHINTDSNQVYDNNYIIHQYEAAVISDSIVEDNEEELNKRCSDMLKELDILYKGIKREPKLVDIRKIDDNYTLQRASNDLDEVKTTLLSKVERIQQRKKEIDALNETKAYLDSINHSDMNLEQLNSLKFFDYEIGSMASSNKIHIKKNYENISAVVLKMGVVKSSVEDIYIVIYPKQFQDETRTLLKALNWNRIDIPEGLSGSLAEIRENLRLKIEKLEDEANELSSSIEALVDEEAAKLDKIYTEIKLEEKILKLRSKLTYGFNTFVINVWIKSSDRKLLEERLTKVTDNNFMAVAKKDSELENIIMPPTKFKNNKFFKPFETIVRMYGLPSYYEIDPTPFLAITFILMFGIMFGDIGQGAVYLIAGLILLKKNKVWGQLLTRLGTSSIVFGFIYGSLFGLEKEELPWLPSLIGKPLDPVNIPTILITGVVFGVVALTVSFLFGILNSFKKKDIEQAVFGKNGIAGYIFFMSLVFTLVSLTGVIPIATSVFVWGLVISLVAMILKEPLTHLIIGKRPLFNEGVSSYFTESIFDGIETMLSTLSNAISFIRVGAFALNHAGLFLAFLVMSQMTQNIFLKLLILILGNVLILTLEGLVVFIQCLRLEYYEMFSKYFQGDGIEFKPLSIIEE